MDVVFEGALSRSWSMADVLRGVMGVEGQPFGVLRISSPGSNVSGRLAIAESKFIIGATLADGSESGFAAVRRLLLAVDGNFAYLDTDGKKPPDFEQGLYVSLARMADLWPALPDNPNELFDEAALLDKIFEPDGKPIDDPSSGHFPIIQPAPKQRPTRASLLQAMKEATDAAEQSTSGVHAKQSWRTMVHPLLSNSLVDGAKTIEGHLPELEDTAPHARQSLTNLRAVDVEEQRRPWMARLLGESFGGKQALLWICVIVVVLLVASFFVIRPNG